MVNAPVPLSCQNTVLNQTDKFGELARGVTFGMISHVFALQPRFYTYRYHETQHPDSARIMSYFEKGAKKLNSMLARCGPIFASQHEIEISSHNAGLGLSLQDRSDS